MHHIIITGLPGSGVTTLSQQIAEETGFEVIHCDDYRYGHGWKKKSYEKYHFDVLHAVNKNHQPKIIEGSYYDADDPENCRARLFHELLPHTKKVIILKIDKLKQASRLIDRCINRAMKVEEKGTCHETSESRGRLLVSAIENYDVHSHALILFKSYVETMKIPVKMVEV